MFSFFKNLFCGCKGTDQEKRRREANEQDREVRESLTEKQIDMGLKDTMAASDPVAKY